jgi:hypothetical protein
MSSSAPLVSSSFVAPVVSEVGALVFRSVPSFRGRID